MSTIGRLAEWGTDTAKSIRRTMKGMGQDSKYFSSSKKGEVSELRAELAASDLDTMKDAVKKVIAAITVGKDMSPLFPDVVNCMRTDNVEVKKLVYLYLINYAKSQPDLTIMAVNSFVKDSEHASPLIRALAIRTMGCIRVEKIVEYLAPPLKKALGDEDPYVRKTAALCVAKLHDISPAIVRTQGFIDNLRDLLSDANPAVVANAVAALSEISEATGREVFEITGAVLMKLLAALNECTEWGQVFILDSLARYTPSDPREAENIIERVTPRLVHQNPAVVLSAVKIVLMYMEVITNAETVNNFCRKLAPPLITLAQAAQPEVQYVALRNISLVVAKRPHLLSHKIKVFFCKYNDPIYVKMEKLDILVRLVNDKNVDAVLLELKEYASEVDVDYVRRAVRTIGRCAIKLEVAAEKCIKVLLQLIATKVNYVTQEAIIVIKDIFRRYPNRYESIIAVLCQSLETLDEPEAKAAMVWIIGEYADRIDNAGELLETFLAAFHDEPTSVQLQLLTATVKLFLKRPAESESLVSNVLSMATEHSDNPDLRDRGYIYWRLLSADAEAAKAVVLAERPVIADDSAAMEPALADLLIRNLSNLAAVYHKPPEAFVRRARPAGAYDEGEGGEGDDDDEYGYGDGEVTASEADLEKREAAAAATAPSSAVSDLDLLGLGGGSPAAPVAAAAGGALGGAGAAAAGGGGGGLLDIFGGPAPAAAAPAVPSHPVLGEKDGLVIRGAFVRCGGRAALELVAEHRAAGASGPLPVGATALKLNKNVLGAVPAEPAVNFPSVAVGSSGAALVPLAFDAGVAAPGPDPLVVQAAIRDNASGRVVFFNIPLAPSYGAFFVDEGRLEAKAFVETWRTLAGAPHEAADIAREVASLDPEAVKAHLAARAVHHLATRPGPDPAISLHFYSARAADGAGNRAGAELLFELTFKTGVPGIKVVAKTSQPEPFAKLAAVAMKALLAP